MKLTIMILSGLVLAGAANAKGCRMWHPSLLARDARSHQRAE